jgi:hypothetical protein
MRCAGSGENGVKMDKTKDLILGVLSGPQYQMKYPGIEAYVVSIKRSGFAGRKVMLCWNIHPYTREIFTQYGFELVDIDPWPSEAFFHARVRLVYEYLRDHHKEFRFVHWLDIKDLCLQSDPSIWLEDYIGRYSIIGSSESVTIEHEETNWLWANEILGKTKANEIKNFQVFNGGTFSGKAEAMAEVFHQVHLLCQEYHGGYPPCQISMAYVLNTMFKKDFYTPKWAEGYACCTHPVWSPWRMPCYPHMQDLHPSIDLATGFLYPGEVRGEIRERIQFHDDWHGNYSPNWGHYKEITMLAANVGPLYGIACIEDPKGKPFAVVHGYDRDWTIKQFFEYKYRFEGDFDLKEFRKYYKTIMDSIPVPRRGLRRRYEGTISSSVVPQAGRIFKRHT